MKFPRLIHNWRRTMRYAWSIRLLILAGALNGLEVALPLLEDVLPLDRGVFASLAGMVVMLAFLARFIAQPSIDGDEQ